MIDVDGYRLNVGMVIMREDGSVLWARRIRHDGWQFPQGGINSDETPIEAMHRELHEETGLAASDVEVLCETPGWLRYRLPACFIRKDQRPPCIGQKQVWFLLRMTCAEEKLNFNQSKPEFDGYKWVDYWQPLDEVVKFKRRVYEQALVHFTDAAQAFAPQAPILARTPTHLSTQKRRT